MHEFAGILANVRVTPIRLVGTIELSTTSCSTVGGNAHRPRLPRQRTTTRSIETSLSFQC